MEPEAPEMPTMIRLGACAMRPPARHGTPSDWLGWPRMTEGGASAPPDDRDADLRLLLPSLPPRLQLPLPRRRHRPDPPVSPLRRSRARPARLALRDLQGAQGGAETGGQGARSGRGSARAGHGGAGGRD